MRNSPLQSDAEKESRGGYPRLSSSRVVFFLGFEMLNFFVSENIVNKTMTEGAPWDFAPTPEALDIVRAKKKDDRRKWLITAGTIWQVYSAVCGEIRTARVNAIENPPRAMRGLAVDYDSVIEVEYATQLINQMPEKFQPQFLEITIGKKARLVWVFEAEVLVAGFEYCKKLTELFFDKLNIATLLPGFDPASAKPAEVWTNGGVWYELKKTPMSNEVVRGVAVEMARKASMFDKAEIPLAVVAEEVNKRWPGRWLGEFALDKIGVRFWDPTADCPSGCQTKLDGMLCFTGKVPFVSWQELFGREWFEEQRVVNLGKAAADILFDGKNYWERSGTRWVPRNRQSAMLILKERGMSDKAAKGASISEAEKVLRYVEREDGGWVDGAASFVNYKPGIIHLNGKKMLNTSTFKPLAPAENITGDPAVDFPFIWKFLQGHFAHPELNPLHYFLGWVQRFYQSIWNYDGTLGQSLFLCGPQANGKTLLCLRLVGGLCGDRYSSPMEYFYGESGFNDEIFMSPLIVANDEDAPRNDAARTRYATKLKAFAVNPTHTYHPKFCARLIVEWFGRIFITMNDDPASVAMLPEVNDNTYHKMSFFGSKKFEGPWPSEGAGTAVKRELPNFARWLLDHYKMPDEVRSDDPRIGVKSFYDPTILDLSKQQFTAFNLVELLRVWAGIDDQVRKDGGWVGTPTELIARLNITTALGSLMRDWTVARMAKSLTALARLGDAGVCFGDGQRTFKIDSAKLIHK